MQTVIVSQEAARCEYTFDDLPTQPAQAQPSQLNQLNSASSSSTSSSSTSSSSTSSSSTSSQHEDTPVSQSDQQQPQLAQAQESVSTGTIITKVKHDNGGTSTPEAFTIEIVADSGYAEPSSFKGSEQGQSVDFVGEGPFDFAPNQEPGYTRSLGEDCPTGPFPPTFTCTLIYDDVPQPEVQESIAEEKVPEIIATIIVNVVNNETGEQRGRQSAGDFRIKIVPTSGTAGPPEFDGKGPPGQQVRLIGAGWNGTYDFVRIPPGYVLQDDGGGPDCPRGNFADRPSFTCIFTFDDIPVPISTGKVALAVIGGQFKGQSQLFTVNAGSPGLTAEPSSFKGVDETAGGTTVKFYGSSGVKTPQLSNLFKVLGPNGGALPPGYSIGFGNNCPPADAILPSTFSCLIRLNFEPLPPTRVNYSGYVKVEVIGGPFDQTPGEFTIDAGIPGVVDANPPNFPGRASSGGYVPVTLSYAPGTYIPVYPFRVTPSSLTAHPGYTVDPDMPGCPLGNLPTDTTKKFECTIKVRYTLTEPQPVLDHSHNHNHNQLNHNLLLLHKHVLQELLVLHQSVFPFNHNHHNHNHNHNQLNPTTTTTTTINH